MTAASPWHHSQVTVAATACPTLADALGLDAREITEWLLGVDDGTESFVLAELVWDISEDDGWASPGGSDSGEVRLAASGSLYWFIQSGAVIGKPIQWTQRRTPTPSASS